MDLKYSVERWKEITHLLFSKPETGKIFRIKGFTKSTDKYYEINATVREISIEESADGQDVIIVIGENLNEQLINNIVYQR